jgi:hypothetical protein
MLELTVAALDYDQIPAVGLKHLQNIANVHGVTASWAFVSSLFHELAHVHPIRSDPEADRAAELRNHRPAADGAIR